MKDCSKLILCLLLVLAGCSNHSADSKKQEQGKAEQEIQLSKEDILMFGDESSANSGILTGTVQPKRLAVLSAELSALVIAVNKENGEKVRQGEVIAKLDATSIKEGLSSATEASRVAEKAVLQADLQYQRMKRLRGMDLASLQELEDAEIRLNSAKNDRASALAREAQAKQQLDRVDIKAPFDGIVTEKNVSVGDTVQIGKVLAKVVDPTSMQVVAHLSADLIKDVRIGQSVNLQVAGQDGRRYAGKIKRIDPEANPVTRQVEVLVSFDNADASIGAGMYAEGRLKSMDARSLMIRNSAIVRDGVKSYAWKIDGDTLKKVELGLGERDMRHGDYPVISGLALGDKVIRRPSNVLHEGMRITVAEEAKSPTVR